MSANTLAVDLYSEPLPRREGFFVLRVEYVNIVFIMYGRSELRTYRDEIYHKCNI